MDGENNGKPYLKWMIWDDIPLFSETSIYRLLEYGCFNQKHVFAEKNRQIWKVWSFWIWVGYPWGGTPVGSPPIAIVLGPSDISAEVLSSKPGCLETHRDIAAHEMKFSYVP